MTFNVHRSQAPTLCVCRYSHLRWGAQWWRCGDTWHLHGHGLEGWCHLDMTAYNLLREGLHFFHAIWVANADRGLLCNEAGVWEHSAWWAHEVVDSVRGEAWREVGVVGGKHGDTCAREKGRERVKHTQHGTIPSTRAQQRLLLAGGRATPTFHLRVFAAHPWASYRGFRGPLPCDGQESVHPEVLGLVVLQLHNVLQPIESAPEVDLPGCRVSFALVFSCVLRPGAKERSVPLCVVAAFLGMNPRNPKNGLFFVHPLQAVVGIAVDLLNQPVLHSLRTLVVALPTSLAQFGWNLVARHVAFVSQTELV